MDTGIDGVRRWLAVISAVNLITGCGNDRDSTRSPAAAHAGGNAARAASPAIGRDALSIRKDPARNRLWVLTFEDVRIYDATTAQLLRKVELPNWSAAYFMCQPDIALDGSGSATVSSNVEARLWRIDADSLEVTEREIVLIGKERWDTGFGAVAYAADGALLALTSSGGSLWSVDFARGSARLVDPNAPLSNGCELPMQLQSNFERRQGPWMPQSPQQN